MIPKTLFERWRKEYNQVRRHSGIAASSTCSRGHKASSHTGDSVLKAGTIHEGRSMILTSGFGTRERTLL